MRIEEITEAPRPKTLREFAEWYKKAYAFAQEYAAGGETIIPMSDMIVVDKLFVEYTEELAAAQGVPAGWLAGAVTSLVMLESSALERAAQEATEAVKMQQLVLPVDGEDTNGRQEEPGQGA